MFLKYQEIAGTPPTKARVLYAFLTRSQCSFPAGFTGSTRLAGPGSPWPVERASGRASRAEFLDSIHDPAGGIIYFIFGGESTDSET